MQNAKGILAQLSIAGSEAPTPEAIEAQWDEVQGNKEWASFLLTLNIARHIKYDAPSTAIKKSARKLREQAKFLKNAVRLGDLQAKAYAVSELDKLLNEIK